MLSLRPRSMRNWPLLVVTMLAGCGAPGAVDVSNVRQAVGDSLPTTQGKTVRDQNKIDVVMSGLCATLVFSKAICEAHDTASTARRAEL